MWLTILVPCQEDPSFEEMLVGKTPVLNLAGAVVTGPRPRLVQAIVAIADCWWWRVFAVIIG